MVSFLRGRPEHEVGGADNSVDRLRRHLGVRRDLPGRAPLVGRRRCGRHWLVVFRLEAGGVKRLISSRPRGAPFQENE